MIAIGALTDSRRPTLSVRLRSRLAVPPRLVTFSARGYLPGAPAAQAVLEGHAKTVVAGFNATLAARDVAELEAPLARVPADERGFAYEGSGMALALFDLVTPGSRDRFGTLLRTHGRPYALTAHVGAGWALALLRLRPRDRLGLDPALRWLALDGYGAHAAAVHTQRTVREQAPAPGRLRGYERRAFDHGVGRTLWFVECADPERVAYAAGRFAEDRRADLWAGVGIAAAYTTVAGVSELDRLLDLSGGFRWHLAQGVAQAAMLRLDEGNLNAHTRMACDVLCGRPGEEVAEAARAARAELRPDPTGASFERWRTRVREWLEGDGARRLNPAARRPPCGSA
jgi:enediyne biosynthesis protein E3